MKRHQAAGLLTREEQYILRVHIRDLMSQRDRATTLAEQARLERLIENCRHEQVSDRASRPRGKKQQKGRL